MREKEVSWLTQANIVANAVAQEMAGGGGWVEYGAREYGNQIGAGVLVTDGQGLVLDDCFSEFARGRDKALASGGPERPIGAERGIQEGRPSEGDRIYQAGKRRFTWKI